MGLCRPVHVGFMPLLWPWWEAAGGLPNPANSQPCRLPAILHCPAAAAGQRARDLRTWLTTYAYWNQGGLDNVVSMFLYLAKEAFGVEAAAPEAQPKPPQETPATGGLAAPS